MDDPFLVPALDAVVKRFWREPKVARQAARFRMKLDDFVANALRAATVMLADYYEPEDIGPAWFGPGAQILHGLKRELGRALVYRELDSVADTYIQTRFPLAKRWHP